jgi:chromosome segregation ATPase
MADVTFGFKVTPELKNEIEQFIKDSDFDTHKEWFQHVLTIYKLHQLKHQDGTKRYAGDLDHIDISLTRIQETIVEMMKKSADDAAHQEAEWLKTLDTLQQQLQQSEQKRKDLDTLLKETDEQAQQHKKNLSELQKQIGILDELCTTLKRNANDKEHEIETLRKERDKQDAFDFPATIQRLTEENNTLKQQLQMNQHQIELLRVEYAQKLEIEKMRTDFAKKETELLLHSKGLLQKDVPEIPAQEDASGTPTQEDASGIPARKRGRPAKNEAKVMVTANQPVTEEDEVDEEQEPYVPDQDELQNELFGDETPQSKE